MHDTTYFIAALDPGKEGPPEWMLLFKAGKGSLADGLDYLVDEEAYNLIQAGIAGSGNEVVFDYEHQSVRIMEAPAAGWIKELKWDPTQGILARVDWNDRARKYIASKEYRYYSPVFHVRQSDGRVCGIHSVALTNTPKTKNLKPILAKLGAEPATKEEGMKREDLIAGLKLSTGASDEEILTALAKMGVAHAAKGTPEGIHADVVAALGCSPTDTVSTVVASINVLKQKADNGVSRQEFDAVVAKLAERDAGDAVAAAIAQGKVTPAQKDWAMAYAKKDPEGFQTFVAKASVVVPLGDLPGKKLDASGVVGDEATLAVAKQMGVSMEDIKTYGIDKA